MKLFGKRKRDGSTKPLETTDTSGDKVVEAILKKDPSTWNAKQRRLVKRFQNRRDPDEPAVVPGEEDESDIEEEVGRTIERTVERKGENDTASTVLQSLLAKLPSKQRRKLTRQLERDGKEAEILEEVRKLLSLNNNPSEEEAKAPEEGDGDAGNETGPAIDPATQAKSDRSRKAAADWSELPAEERLRREEQRRLQNLAADKRAKGEIPTARHPLNSERRRANRRKPKWSPPTKKSTGNDHDSSGYLMRKVN